ncbi:hypothetical protein ACWIID_09195 [Streptomyces phaeochromogenes]
MSDRPTADTITIDQLDALYAALDTARLLGGMSEADVQRIIALYKQWVKAGPPPLGASMARWWDARLVELHEAILPTAQTGCRCHKGDELCSGCRRCPDVCHGCDGPKEQYRFATTWTEYHAGRKAALDEPKEQ